MANAIDEVREFVSQALLKGEPHEVISPKVFSLCATFETEGPHEIGPAPMPLLYLRGDQLSLGQPVIGDGRQCFEVG